MYKVQTPPLASTTVDGPAILSVTDGVGLTDGLGKGVTEGVTDGTRGGEAAVGDDETLTIDVVVVFAVAFAETPGLVAVFVVEKRQPATDSEAIITSATITHTANVHGFIFSPVNKTNA